MDAKALGCVDIHFHCCRNPCCFCDIGNIHTSGGYVWSPYNRRYEFANCRLGINCNVCLSQHYPSVIREKRTFEILKNLISISYLQFQCLLFPPSRYFSLLLIRHAYIKIFSILHFGYLLQFSKRFFPFYSICKPHFTKIHMCFNNLYPSY